MTEDMIIAQIMTDLRIQNPNLSREQAEKMARKQLNDQNKINHLVNWLIAKEKGISRRKFSKENNINESTLRNWEKKKELMDKALEQLNKKSNNKVEIEPIIDDVISENLGKFNVSKEPSIIKALPPTENDPTYIDYQQKYGNIEIADYEKDAYIKFKTAELEKVGMDHESAVIEAKKMAEDNQKLTAWVLENRKPIQDNNIVKEEPNNQKYNPYEKLAYAIAYVNGINSGNSANQMAEILGVSESTMNEWLQDPDFKEKVDNQIAKANRTIDDNNKMTYTVANDQEELDQLAEAYAINKSKDDIIPDNIDVYDGETLNAEEALEPSKLQKLKSWVKKHKKAIIVGAALAIGITAVAIHAALLGDTSSVGQVNDVISSTNGNYTEGVKALSQASTIAAAGNSVQAAANAMDPNMIGEAANNFDLSTLNHGVSTNAYDAVAGQNIVSPTNTGVATVGYDTVTNQYVPLEELAKYNPTDLGDHVAVLEGTEELAQKLHGVTDQAQINDIIENNRLDTIGYVDIPSGKTL